VAGELVNVLQRTDFHLSFAGFVPSLRLNKLLVAGRDKKSP
jgi:hypothetical protein